jgi:hypothetical protein
VIFPLPDETVWMPEGNVTRGNTVSESGLADLALSTGAGEGNCFEGNDFTLSDPPQIEQTYGCDMPAWRMPRRVGHRPWPPCLPQTSSRTSWD